MKLEWKIAGNIGETRYELFVTEDVSSQPHFMRPYTRKVGFVRANTPMVHKMLKEQGLEIGEKWVAVQQPRSLKMRRWFDTREEAQAWLSTIVRLS